MATSAFTVAERPAATSTDGGIRRVVLATDLSDTSSEATRRAFDVAAGLRASLLVVSVIDESVVHVKGSERADQLQARREAAIVELVGRGRARGLAIEYLIWTGEPATSIVDAATAESADLIVIGSHGRSGLGRAVLGSVSDHVVRHATCPVMVVRPGTRTTSVPDERSERTAG